MVGARCLLYVQVRGGGKSRGHMVVYWACMLGPIGVSHVSYHASHAGCGGVCVLMVEAAGTNLSVPPGGM